MSDAAHHDQGLADNSAPAPVALYREHLSLVIEHLISLLDDLDGDPDIEATALERAGCGFIPTGHDDDEDTEDTLDWAEQGEPEEWF